MSEGPPANCELLKSRARNMIALLENSVNRRLSDSNAGLKLSSVSSQLPSSMDSIGSLGVEQSNIYIYINSSFVWYNSGYRKHKAFSHQSTFLAVQQVDWNPMMHYWERRRERARLVMKEIALWHCQMGRWGK